MNEAQYFEQFVGDTQPPTYCLGAGGADEYSEAKSLADEILSQYKGSNPQDEFWLEYEDGPWTPYLGRHHFYLMWRKTI